MFLPFTPARTERRDSSTVPNCNHGSTRRGPLPLTRPTAALYVADSENHVIRHVPLGEFDVESLAGSGDPGSQDGAGSAARFRKPLGVVLDGRGFLWVADTGNHTIRRVNLVTGMAKTMAGNAGVPGFADGTGQEARFDSPSSVAIARESLAAQLDRESARSTSACAACPGGGPA